MGLFARRGNEAPPQPDECRKVRRTFVTGGAAGPARAATGLAKAGHYALVAAAIALVAVGGPHAKSFSDDEAPQKTLDEILDAYVRDGFVYYRALKAERGRLDGYVSALAAADPDRLPRDEQIAFWLNAYNALVLRTVIDRYPIPWRSTQYPPGSIRQIPGAFERLAHRVAGRALTLDQIEKTILPAFRDPRVYFVLGRGAVGGGRLRSEAFSADRLESQLAEAARECISRPQCVRVDATTNALGASAIFSWHEPEFVAAYDGHPASAYGNRSPIERAILAFVEPALLTTERNFLTKNTFQLVYAPFDWSLNDLTGRGGR